MGIPISFPNGPGSSGKNLRSQGIHKVLGGIYVDDSAFDPPYEHLCFGQQNAKRPHNPVISATAVNYNTVTVELLPGGDGRTAKDVRSFLPPIM